MKSNGFNNYGMKLAKHFSVSRNKASENEKIWSQFDILHETLPFIDLLLAILLPQAQ